ncbi:MAG: hypothetical protein DRJ67_12135 [Thermoprotei archaeon]|nr:MAG: hypothetical protein DRJ67_12135 [Thermoprotei archaeon]
MESVVQIYYYIAYLGLGTALGMGLGFMIARRKAERMVREILEAYGVTGSLRPAHPELVELAIRRCGGWPLRVRAHAGEER